MKVELDAYKNGYQKLYHWLRTKHPEILQEYRIDIQKDFERILKIRNVSVE